MVAATEEGKNSKTDKAEKGAVVDHKYFAKKVMKDLQGLGASREEVEDAVKELTALYAKDKEGAEAKFQIVHDSFSAARDAEAILADDRKELESQQSLLKNFAGTVEEMNVAKARLIARLGSGLPGVRKIAGAIESLAMLELDMKGLGIDQSVFGTLAGFISKTDDVLQERGIDVNGKQVGSVLKKMKENAAQIVGSDRIASVVDGIKNVAGNLGIDVERLAKGVTARATGVDVDEVASGLSELKGSGPKRPGKTR